MRKFFTQQKNSTKGFTLVETLVAISIFSVAIVTLMVVLGNGVADIGYVKKKIIATYLAQEGVEHLRSLRDTYTLYSDTPAAGWHSFYIELMNESCQTADGCYFDDSDIVYTNPIRPITALHIINCGSAGCPALKYDSDTGKYGYITGATTDFVRKIHIVETSADELEIFSEVSWTQGSGTYHVSFSENLFTWVE